MTITALLIGAALVAVGLSAMLGGRKRTDATAAQVLLQGVVLVVVASGGFSSADATLTSDLAILGIAFAGTLVLARGPLVETEANAARRHTTAHGRPVPGSGAEEEAR